MLLLSARMKKIQLKMKTLEWSQHFSHYKSMGNFPDAQGQITHKSLVGSCHILDSSENLCVSLMPVRLRKIESKMKALEWSQHYALIFQTNKGS